MNHIDLDSPVCQLDRDLKQTACYVLNNSQRKALRLLANIHPYDAEASAVVRSVHASVARESKHNEVGRRVR